MQKIKTIMMLQCGGSKRMPIRPLGIKGVRDFRCRVRYGAGSPTRTSLFSASNTNDKNSGCRRDSNGQITAFQHSRYVRIAVNSHDESTSITESSDRPKEPDITDPETSPGSDNNGNSPSSSAQESITWAQLFPTSVRSFWLNGQSMVYLKECFGVLWVNLWALMSLTALNSAARFILVWTLYKTVCAIAVHFFGVPAQSIPQEMIPTAGSTGDLNGLASFTLIARASIKFLCSVVYQQLADITFLLFKPFDFLLRGIFVAGGLLVCWETRENPKKQAKRVNRFALVKRIWHGFLQSFVSAWSSLKKSPQYIPVYIAVTAMTAFYQALCLLIVPLLYAMQRLLNIQLALCISLVQRKQWKDALETSTDIVKPIRRHLYFPYILLFVMPKQDNLPSRVARLRKCCRALGLARDFVVKVFPDRLFVDVPEITWGLIAMTTVLAFLIDRMADIFPIVVYSSFTKSEKESN